MAEKDLSVSNLLDFYADALTQKQREVMQQYFNDDLSLAEIAANFGITRQGVRDSIVRGESSMRELEEKIGFAKKYEKIRLKLLKLEKLAKEIDLENENSYSKQPQISKCAKSMIDTIKEIEKSF